MVKWLAILTHDLEITNAHEHPDPIRYQKRVRMLIMMQDGFVWR